MEKILNLYDYASRIFESIGDFRLARSQKLKILYVLKNANIETLKLIDNTELSFLNEEKIENIINDCITLSYATHNHSFKIEEAKLETLLVKNEDSKKEIFKSGVIATEVEEVITIYWMLFKKFQKPKLISKKENYFNGDYNIDEYLKNSVSPYSYVKSKNSRTLTLCLLLTKNEEEYKMRIPVIQDEEFKLMALYLRKLKIEEDIDIIDKHILIKLLDTIKTCELNIKTIKDNVSIHKYFIVLNSIGACNEIIKSHNLFGINYVTTSNFEMASAHFKMAKWCKRYEDLKKDMLHDDILKLDKILREQVLNTGTLNYFHSSYYYKLAKDYYNKVTDFHTRGNTLQNFIKTPSYLDDFFNDNLIHFSISVERNKVQENVVNDQIVEIEKVNPKNTELLKDYYL